MKTSIVNMLISDFAGMVGVAVNEANFSKLDKLESSSPLGYGAFSDIIEWMKEPAAARFIEKIATARKRPAFQAALFTKLAFDVSSASDHANVFADFDRANVLFGVLTVAQVLSKTKGAMTATSQKVFDQTHAAFKDVQGMPQGVLDFLKPHQA